MTKQKQQVTSAKDWKRPYDEGFEIGLPSGNVVKLRPVPLAKMLAVGELPDVLTLTAAQAVFAGDEGDKGDKGERDEKLIELAISSVKLMDYVCKLSFVKPIIVDKIVNEDLEILAEHVEMSDKEMVFQAAMQPALVLRNFRSEQERSLAALSDSKDDGDEAK